MKKYCPINLPSSYITPENPAITAEPVREHYRIEYEGKISPHYLHPNGPFKLYTQTPCNELIDPENPSYGPEDYDLRWCVGDNKKNWEENMRKYYPSGKLKFWKYADPDRVWYNLNEEGYRCPEWDEIDWPNTWCVLGCSFVFGVGLAEDETIAHYLQKYIGEPVINLGCGGGSNELIKLLIARQRNNLPKPKGFIVLYTSEDRGIVYTKRGVLHNGPWAIPNKLTPHTIIRTDEHGEKYVACEKTGTNQTWHYLCNYEDEYNAKTKLYDIHQVINAMTTRDTFLFEGSWFKDSAKATYCHDLSRIVINNQESKARDLWHPGSEVMDVTAREISDILINKIVNA